MAAADWAHVFVGRKQELASLRAAFEAARSGSPRVVAIVAESGFGKTRLVQEFFNWLSTAHDGIGGAGYWPDRLMREEDNLRVNPDFAECGTGDSSMPFMWWGIRLLDPGGRNQIGASALWPALEDLKPHLGALAKAIEARRAMRSGAIDLANGLADVGFAAGEAALNAATFGLLGVGKTVAQTGWGIYRARQRLLELDALGASPAAEGERARDELVATILTDMQRLAKTPAKGFSPVPLVVFIDDAHWMSQDAGVGTFAQALVDRARAESWPLLLILTSWRREWQETNASGSVPGCLCDATRGDIFLELGGVAGLEAVVHVALAGLTDGQTMALVERTQGNPRFLDETLLYLDKNPKHFESRDKTKPLTPSGLATTLALDFPAVIADRLREAPAHVRRALAIASVQGVAFSPRLAVRTAEALGISDAPAGLQEGENPHSFIRLRDPTTDGEFRLRPYWEAARDDLGNVLDETEVGVALSDVMSAIAADVDAATDRELSLLLGSETAGWVIEAAGVLIRRAKSRLDLRAAGEVAERAMPFLDDSTIPVSPEAVLDVIEVALTSQGPNRAHEELLRALVAALEADPEEQDSANRQLLARGLVDLGTVIFRLERPSEARSYIESAEKILSEDHTLQVRRYHAIALLQLSRVLIALDDKLTALQCKEEAERIARGVASDTVETEIKYDMALVMLAIGMESRNTGDFGLAHKAFGGSERIMHELIGQFESPQATIYYAVSHMGLGEATMELSDPAAARRHYEEADKILREVIAVADHREDLRLYLLANLALLGEAVSKLEGNAAARRYHEEKEKIARELATELGTPQARGRLASALASLGNTIAELEGHAAARRYCEEEEKIRRELAAELGTPQARRDLAIALYRLANTVAELDGNAAARSYREEEEMILRELATEPGTAQARSELGVSLSRLGSMVAELDGSAAARRYHEEEEKIRRELATELGTPQARRDLFLALLRCGDTVEELDGPAAARRYREEAEKIARELATELGTPQARRDLVVALGRLGDTVAELDGNAAARRYREEEEKIARELATELGTPQARRDLVVALSRLGGTIEIVESLTAAQRLREEALEVIRKLRGSKTDANLLRLELQLEREILRGLLLGKDGWSRAFAYHTIRTEAASALIGSLQALHARFVEWAESVGPTASFGWPESVEVEVARCLLATGDAVAALQICLTAERNLCATNVEFQNRAGSLLAELALVRARSLAERGEPAAESAFRVALHRSDANRKGRSASEDQYATVAWFWAEDLAAQRRQNEAQEAFQQGLVAARAFARFATKQGLAILAAYERRAKSLGRVDASPLAGNEQT